MPIAAVGFDLDGTLVVPTRDRQTLLNQAATAVDADPLERDDYLDAHQDHLAAETREPIFSDLLANRDDSPDPDSLSTAYREAVNAALVPIDGVPDMISTLRDRYRVGLLTNGPGTAQRAKLRTLGWETSFDAVVISGEIGTGKPDIRAFEALFAALDADPNEIVYVGDSADADIAGANAAGCHTIHVRRETGAPPAPRAEHHLTHAEMASRLPEILGSLD